MAAFEKNNLGWQLNQLQQKIGEWWELQLSKWKINLPEIPDNQVLPWLDSQLSQAFAKIGFWVVLAILLGWIGLKITRLARFYLYSGQNQQPQTVISNSKRDTLLSVAQWLARSQQFQQQGNYQDACLCLYQAMLQQLNDTGIAPHQNSRTDGEYLQIIEQLPRPLPYQTLLITHQQLCFGNAQATPTLLETCKQAYREIEEVAG